MAAISDAVPSQEEVDRLKAAQNKAEGEWVSLNREVEELKQRLESTEQDEEKKKLKKEIDIKDIKMKLAYAKWGKAHNLYYQRHYEKERAYWLHLGWDVTDVDGRIRQYKEKVVKWEEEIQQHQQRLLEMEQEEGAPVSFVLPQRSLRKGYKCVAQSSLVLVYFSEDSQRGVTIESILESVPETSPRLQSNEILLSPVVKLSIDGSSISSEQPAIVELLKCISPVDRKIELIPLHSIASPVQWKELTSHDCMLLEDRVIFKTKLFGYLTVIGRFPFPMNSIEVKPTQSKPVELKIEEVPHFKVAIPPASVSKSTKVYATVLHNDPIYRNQLKSHSLASICVKLEPHNLQFKNEVTITIPIPCYDEVIQKHPNAKLQLRHSKNSNEDSQIEWETFDDSNFTLHRDENGTCLATACITHFSILTYMWDIITSALNFFVKAINGRCQAFMSRETIRGSLLKFGIAILIYPFKEPYQDLANHTYLLLDSVEPFEVTAGEVECQVELHDDLISNDSQKCYKVCNRFSQDNSIRADFCIELDATLVGSELLRGPIATLLIKHGSTENKFNLIKNEPLSSPTISEVHQLSVSSSVASVTASLVNVTDPSSTSDLHHISMCPSSPEEVVDSLSHQITMSAQKLTETSEQLEANPVTESTKRIAKHWQEIARLASCTQESAEENITETMQIIIKESETIMELSRQVAEACCDSRLKQNVLDVVGRIPVIALQLKSLLRRMKHGNYLHNLDTADEARGLLVTNATNLTSTLETVLYAIDRANIKVQKPKLERLKQSTANCDSVSNPYFSAARKPALHELYLLKGPKKIIRIINRIAPKWDQVAITLHFETHEIEGIERDCRQTGDASRKMIMKWLGGGGNLRKPIAWATLIEALEEADLAELAKDIVSILQESDT